MDITLPPAQNQQQMSQFCSVSIPAADAICCQFMSAGTLEKEGVGGGDTAGR